MPRRGRRGGRRDRGRRRGDRGRRSRPDLPPLLHDQAARHRAGARHRPPDRGRTRRQHPRRVGAREGEPLHRRLARAPPRAVGESVARILVVDDELSMREFLEILLRKRDHEVLTVASLPAALAVAQEGDLDLVVTDLRLGDASGLELLREVKARAPATEVVIITAFATAENAVQAMKLGAYDYVLKPFKVDEIKLVVAKALERRALVA